jgi:protein-S-isoprenylcysteine O-methyltransferase Ste14
MSMASLPFSPSKPGSAALRPGTKLHDLLFGVPLILWYGAGMVKQAPLLAAALAHVAWHDPAGIIPLLSRAASLLFAGVLIVLVMIRRPSSQAAPGFLPKIVAFLGAFLGIAILTLPHTAVAGPLALASALLTFAGMSFALYALLWLGRSIGVLSEARDFVQRGPYRYVRHPLYLGEEISLLGITLQFLSPAACALFALQLFFQLWRMNFEEQVMREAFPEYGAYAARVKRLIPGVY